MRCAACGSTARWCDCLIAAMTPQERIAQQDVIVAVYLAALDRREFERRRLAEPMRKTVRGQFGNRHAGERRTA